MKKQHFLVGFTIIAGIAVVNLMTATAQQNGGRPYTKVAVVDVQDVFNTCKEKADIDANFQSSLETAQADQEDRKKEIKQLEFDLDLIDKGNTQFQEKREEIFRKIIALRIEAEYRKNQIVREQMLRYENLYTKLRESCGEVARTSGYDIVLFKEASVINYKQPQELVNQIGGRKLLWAASELEITDQVIQKLNNAWASR